MENNNENQNSTEQLYASIEESTIELEKNVEEEPSYSLEDLHPEEEVKEVAPAASHAEEVQPDPTVIDGKRETIGVQSSIMEIPQNSQIVQPVHPPQPQPVQMVVPPQTLQPMPKIQKPTSPEEPNAKVFYALFAIILAVVLIGFPLYTSINKSLESNPEESEVQQEEPKENEQETPPQTETQIPQTNQIDFNMSLEFDKGLILNEKETNQKVGYLPTNLNGVIRCDLEHPTNINGITTYASTYLHYENYKLRSAISVTRQVYSDPAIYMSNKDATLIYKTAGDKEETLDVEIKQDDENYTITNIMQYNLMYGHQTPIEGLNPPYIQFSSQYNTNIKSAMNNLINNQTNIVCGTINTENATQ